VGCLFVRGVYSTEKIIDALGLVGIERTEEELDSLGRRIFDEKYRFKRREGFSLGKARTPGRFYETISTMGMVDPETIETMMEIYVNWTVRYNSAV
jgi:aldehyde:ferredoxin oxidoreductase